jgi:hypothetical protein
MLPMRGPCMQLTRTETERVRQLLRHAPTNDPRDAGLLAKCDRTLTSDPRWRTPTK